MPPTQITKAEFKVLTEEYWNWCSTNPHSTSSWFLSLSDWAETRFNQEYNKEKNATLL